MVMNRGEPMNRGEWRTLVENERAVHDHELHESLAGPITDALGAPPHPLHAYWPLGAARRILDGCDTLVIGQDDPVRRRLCLTARRGLRSTWMVRAVRVDDDPDEDPAAIGAAAMPEMNRGERRTLIANERVVDARNLHGMLRGPIKDALGAPPHPRTYWPLDAARRILDGCDVLVVRQGDAVRKRLCLTVRRGPESTWTVSAFRVDVEPDEDLVANEPPMERGEVRVLAERIHARHHRTLFRILAPAVRRAVGADRNVPTHEFFRRKDAEMMTWLEYRTGQFKSDIIHDGGRFRIRAKVHRGGFWTVCALRIDGTELAVL